VTKPIKEKTMTPMTHHKRLDSDGQATIEELLQERLRLSIKMTLMRVLEEEVDAFVKASPYQRTNERRDYRNGTYERDLGTSMGVIEDLPVPRTRHGYRTELFERYQRRQAELDQAICEMFVDGISTARVGEVVEALSGEHPSPSTVSRVFHGLEAEFEGWKKRMLQARYLYVFADGTYFTVIYDSQGEKMPILAVIGIDPEGKREILVFTIGDRENQKAWEDLMEDLKARGVQHVDLWITDGGQAMINAIEHKFSASKRQRCVKHKIENVLGYIPKKQHQQIYSELKSIFYQANREKAQQVVAAFEAKYRPIYPTAIACLNRDLDACLTFYGFPEEHRQFIRTSNVIERLFCEVKKRSHKMAAAFRNEDSCLLLFYAVIRGLKLRRIPIIDKVTSDPLQLLHNS
jgi:putative transposase